MRSALLGLLLASGAALAQPLPVLQFEPPQGFTGSLGRDPSAHVSMNGDAIINVYPFRRLDGGFEDQFRRTRLRELLQPDSQEAQLAGQAEIQPIPLPGAQAALAAKFVENRSGRARHRLRLAIYSGGAVAIVDYNAAGPDGYQRNWPALAGVLDSLRIVSETRTETKPAAGSTGGVDGLYLASTRRFAMRIGGRPARGGRQDAPPPSPPAPPPRLPPPSH